MKCKIKDYNTLKIYCRNKKIDMIEMTKFLNYLKDEGFIEYE